MIDELNANCKVGQISIKIVDDNQNNAQLIM